MSTMQIIMNAVIFLIFGFLSISTSSQDYINNADSIEHHTMSIDKENIFDSYHHMTDLEDYLDICYDYTSEQCAKEWLDALDVRRKRNSNRLANIAYQSATDINDENSRLRMKYMKQNINIFTKMKKRFKKFQWRHFKSSRIRRIFKLESSNIDSKNGTILEMLLNVSSQIKDIYNHGRPCYGDCLEEGESGIVELFATETDYDRLSGFWSSWRDVTGKKIKELFLERISLRNIGARENGHSDAASFQLEDDFEEKNFNVTVLRLYEEILPLYEQLHGFVRYCLSQFYPGRFDKNGPIPAHILGNVWGQQWINLLPIIEKCRNKDSDYNIHKEATEKIRSMSVSNMFKMAEEFYTSIGMYKMTPYFWRRSVIEKQPGKLMDCHASAYNFANGADFRVKMCTRKNVKDFTTIHHEMGHIQYYMAYRNLPHILFGSANPGFHEAIGDTIALSVKTPEHLKKIGLISEIPSSSEFDIDYLLATALEKVVFLPFALTMDSYLWSVSNGSVPHDRINKHWWDLRYRFQGLKPPVKRTENDFDPGAKYHMAFGRAYIRYFVSYLLQFQFYESMCKLSKYQGPLHRCDFFQSKAAGSRLLKMLKKGQSQHWHKTLKILTGTESISTDSIMKFFKPLYEWLKETNKKMNIQVGW